MLTEQQHQIIKTSKKEVYNSMGNRGHRNITINSTYSEPTLMKDVDDLLKKAKENGCYDGDKLDIDRVIEFVNKTNPKEPVSLEYVQMEPATSGSLIFENGIWVIRVNKNHNSRRQRFTIAHEIGHYIMHRNKLQSFTDEVFFRAGNREDIEYRANDFASKLLMPEKGVRKAIAEGVRNIGLLAERFEVSSPAMKIRVQDLGYKLKQNG